MFALCIGHLECLALFTYSVRAREALDGRPLEGVCVVCGSPHHPIGHVQLFLIAGLITDVALGRCCVAQDNLQ